MEMVTYLSSILGLLSFAIAIFQTYRSQRLKKFIEIEKRRKELSIWTEIKLVVKNYDALSQAGILLKETKIEEASLKVQSAKRAIVDHYRLLLKEAALLEPNFDMSVVEKWEKMGRIENEWRKNQAINLIQTKDYE